MIETISISIYDTTLPQVSEENILDFAEKGSIHWVYDGGDNKFLTMMASRLEFDMEVSIEESLDVLVYDYLFTGNETRYSVIMRDQDENVLWRGFLIPEEYVEPYDKATFFIHFTATDGLGRLRGHTLPQSFYRARQSVIKVIADCLKKTGLELEIWLDGSIHNKKAEGLWETLFVDAQQWFTEETPANCYDILNALLEEIGATIFQQNDRWYIVPWNRRGSTNTFSMRKYTKDGIPVNYTSVAPEQKPVLWYATPSISIKAPFREVTVDTGISESVSVFPEDVVEQKVSITETLITLPQDIYPAYWTSETLDLFLFDTSQYFYPEYLGEPLDFVWSPTFWRKYGVQEYPANLNYYMTLKNPEYVKEGGFLDIELEIRSSYEASGDASGIDDDKIMYEILLDNETIISNKPGWAKRELYKLKFDNQLPYGDSPIISSGVLSLKDYELTDSGYINIRIYYGVNAYGNSPFFLTVPKLNVNYKQAKIVFKKRRNIDFTFKNAVSIFHGDSVIPLETRSFVYQPVIPEADFIELQFAAGYEFDPTRNNRPLGWCLFFESASFDLVFDNKYQLYVIRENSDFPEYIKEVAFLDVGYDLVKVTLPDGYLIRESDRFLIRTTGFPGDPQITSYIEAREQWEKTVYSGNGGRLGDVLAETYHDLQPESMITMEGNLKGLVQPLDVMQFELKNTQRNFIPIRIDMLPNENQTSITMVEYKNQSVGGYGW